MTIYGKSMISTATKESSSIARAADMEALGIHSIFSINSSVAEDTSDMDNGRDRIWKCASTYP